jgi:4-amino-4-deoxy-L-arabinose transferase-like glycosyltransferase
VQCRGCGATATSKSVAAALPGDKRPSDRQWLLPVLLCLFFPPALLVIVPILFWRWLRRDNRGWIVPVLICMAFPPAVLIVAPALLWRTPKRQQVP